jgi:outer membrane usher protein
MEARVTNTSVLASDPWHGGRLDGGGNVTSMTLGTAIAFADGAFAIGPPIRGHGFAIVEPHPSLAGRRVTIGTHDHPYAHSDALGPALVTDVPAYAPRSLPVDVDDLPLGYSLGQGGFETHAPYRGGYRIVVGSDYSVTAYGTLLDAGGEPLGLVSGTAQEVDQPDKQVAVFTNAAGRFGIDGVAPGRWIIEMAAEPGSVRYVIEVPKGTDGLFRAGTLSPVRVGAP